MLAQRYESLALFLLLYDFKQFFSAFLSSFLLILKNMHGIKIETSIGIKA
jgi:hypothetical protein